jgi:hypothetical protein
MIFECVREKGHKTERWQGIILGLREYESHCEFRIEARSGIMVVIGKTVCGWFACMPDFGAGCHISELDDICWNTEQLTDVLGEVDGITVASALYALSGTIDL